MDRRAFVKLAPAFPLVAVTASLVLHEKGKEDIELDVSVLKAQPGDTIVLSTQRPISNDTRARIEAHVERLFPALKAMVLSDGLAIEGVLRTR